MWANKPQVGRHPRQTAPRGRDNVDAVATKTQAAPGRRYVQPAKTPVGRTTTIFHKILMAVTGLVFTGFVAFHMYGNLMAFGGQHMYDNYAEHLRTFLMPILPYEGFLWMLRIVLLVLLAIHIWAATNTWRRSKAARGSKYGVRQAALTAWRTKWMRWGGVFIFAFIVFHILHFTTHNVVASGYAGHSPYQRLVAEFGVWWIFVIYFLALVALGLHLFHGVWSACQSLGWTSSALSRRVAKIAGTLVAIAVAGGFLATPLAIVVGIIQ